MNSDPEDLKKILDSTEDAEIKMEMNGDVTTPQENGKHQTVVVDGSSPVDEEVASISKSAASCEDSLSVIEAKTGEQILVGQKKELPSKNVGLEESIQKEKMDETMADVNGQSKAPSAISKDGKPPVQRRMSLRQRAAPKKYSEADGNSDDDVKDQSASVKDPLEIPLGKNSSTVLIRKSPIASVVVKSPPKPLSPVKMTKVMRPPPELIKAPILSKISISSATSVTVVPRSKENNSSSRFVVVDTQSILKGKNATSASNVPASVTVSAVPPLPKTMPKPTPPPTTSSASRKNITSSNSNSTSLPDPFESLGLADDSFIVEAPSFVVPYLIEKSASQNLKKTVQSMDPFPTSEKKEDVIVLSEEDSNDSGKKETDDVKSTSATAIPGGSPLDKSSMKSEMDKSIAKSDTNKEDENYFAGPIGRFFLDIGLSLVQEYVQGDLLRVQKRKVHKGTKISDPSLTVNALTKGLDVTRAKNDPFRLPLRSCDRCSFKSESSLTMAHHWSLPLALGSGSSARHVCHWCSFEAKEPHLVSAHIETDHGMKSRIGPDLPLHQCPLCPFEDNVKSKVTRHMLSCQKRFVADRNLEPPLDWEPPAKIPRMPARGMRTFAPGMNNAVGLHGYSLASTKGLSLPYHPLLPKSALVNTLGYNSGIPSAGTGQNHYLGNMPPVVQGKGNKTGSPSQSALAGLRLPAELHVVSGVAPRVAGTPSGSASQAKVRDGRQQVSNQSSPYLNPSSYGVPNNQIYQAIAKSFQLLQGHGSSMSVLPSTVSKNQSPGASALEKLKKASNTNSISLLPGLVNTSGLTIQSSSTPTANKTKTNQQPSISITPLPRSSTSTVTNKPSLSVSPVTPAATNTTVTVGNNTVAAKAGQPATPGQKGGVVCEICDSTIKDLEQLRHHMQWIHKVKIHPKMIHNRPPLNCQKCQCRFFTDQGLERHLLGSHGLVTSSMQEAANRGQDGGRCPICGKVHQWKLLSHVVKDHGLSLKPAHLSYKCTVCTATFTMYKLFENHVYTAHSVVARKVLDKDKVDIKKGSSGSTNSSTTGALRINDEITIIPQTTRHDSSDQNSCRPSKGEKRSRVDIIDLSDDEDNKDGLSLPKSQVTITKVPAPKGYLSRNNRESMSKRSRTDDNDTE